MSDTSRRRVVEIGLAVGCVVLVVWVAVSVISAGKDTNSIQRQLEVSTDSANRAADRARLR